LNDVPRALRRTKSLLVPVSLRARGKEASDLRLRRHEEARRGTRARRAFPEERAGPQPACLPLDQRVLRRAGCRRDLDVRERTADGRRACWRHLAAPGLPNH
jgi:hypothetical protein